MLILSVHLVSAVKINSAFNRIIFHFYLKIFYHDNLTLYLIIYRVVIIRSRDRDPSTVYFAITFKRFKLANRTLNLIFYENKH